jgi:hypothetical protein
VIIITTIFNIILYYSAYKRNYDEGKKLFSRGIIITQGMAIIYSIQTGHYESISYIISAASLTLLALYYTIPLLFPKISDHDYNIITKQQEIALYCCIYAVFYRFFSPNYSAIIVIQLWFTTCLIAIRQSYLTTKDTVLSKKRD